jgi:hypothetical protein
MRLYPRSRIGSVVMATSSQFNSCKFLNQTDLATFRNDGSARPEGCSECRQLAPVTRRL